MPKPQSKSPTRRHTPGAALQQRFRRLLTAAKREQRRAHTPTCGCDFCKALARAQEPPAARPPPRQGVHARLDERTELELRQEMGRSGETWTDVAARILGDWAASPKLQQALVLPGTSRGPRHGAPVFIRPTPAVRALLCRKGRKPNTAFYAVLIQWADRQGHGRESTGAPG